ncbi:MAG: DUF485 domain-containing protein [Blastocatellia bacterium]
MPNDQEPESASGNLTPIVMGSVSGISPLRPPGPHPQEDLTADDGSSSRKWGRIVQMPEFKNMLRAKLKFIVPATLFFVIYYFALPVLVGYAPELMSKRVFGVVNIAYLFALSQFVMAWTIAALYLRAASRFDKMERRIIEKAREK